MRSRGASRSVSENGPLISVSLATHLLFQYIHENFPLFSLSSVSSVHLLPSFLLSFLLFSLPPHLSFKRCLTTSLSSLCLYSQTKICSLRWSSDALSSDFSVTAYSVHHPFDMTSYNLSLPNPTHFINCIFNIGNSSLRVEKLYHHLHIPKNEVSFQERVPDTSRR